MVGRLDEGEVSPRPLDGLEATYASAPVGLCVLDRELRYVRINERLAQINGLPAAAHIGRTVREIVPALADQVEPMFRRILETGEPVLDLELTGETSARPGVQRTWVESWLPLRDARGEVVGINIVAQDVTEQRARERLIHEQAHLLDVVEQAVIATDLEGRIRFWNRHAETLYGWRADEVQGRSVLEVTPAPEAEALAAEIMAALQAGERWSGEFTVRRRDGTTFPALVTDSPVLDADGRLVGMVGVSVDISERKRAERSLRVSEERFRATFENAAVGMAHLSLEGRWLRVNERLCHIAGLTQEALLGGAIADITFPEDVPREQEAMRELLAGEVASYTSETRLFHGSGDIVWVGLTASLVRSASGEPAYVIAVIEDIGQRKEAEARLRSALAVKDELLGFVSHELRTPMTVILGMSRLLARGEYEAELIHEVAADIADSAEILSGLLESMLMLARLNREGARHMREPLLLGRAAADVLARQRLRDGSRAYELEVSVPGILVEVERALVEQVIENMVVNAAKYSHPGRPVRVTVAMEQGSASVRVLDEGPGIAEQDMGRIFEPFYRAAGARHRAGAGLGLAVSKRIVELLDGTIWARQQPSGGAEFGFTLPLLEVDES